MALDDLKQLFEDPALTLDTLIGESNIADLALKCLGALDAIPITADPDASDYDAYTIVGTAEILGDEMRVTLMFATGENEDDIQLTLVAEPSPSWMFGLSFPNLPAYINSENEAQPSFLNILEFTQPQFVFTSQDFTPEFSDLTYLPGLSFSGSVEKAGILAPLEIITGSSDPIFISGLLSNGDEAIDREPAPEEPAENDQPTEEAEPTEEDIPQMFTLSAGIPFDLGGDIFKFSNALFEIQSSLAPDAPAGTSAIHIEVDFQLAEDNLITLFADFKIGAAEPITIGALLEGITLPGLGDIAELVGGADLAGELPESMSDLGSLKINAFSTDIDIVSPFTADSIQGVMIDIGSAAEWVIVPDIIVIQELGMVWNINQPFSTVGANIGGEIYGQIKFGEGDSAATLAVDANLTDVIVNASLVVTEEEKGISVGALLEKFAPDTEIPEGDLIITELTLQADPRNRTYNFTAIVKNDWALNLGFDIGSDPAEFRLQELSLQLDYIQSAIGVVISANMMLLGAAFAVSATREPALSGQGTWLLAAGLQPDTTLQVGRIVTDLVGAAVNSTLEVPEAITNLAFTQLDVTYDTGVNKRYTFAGALEPWVIDLGPYQFTIDASLELESFYDIEKLYPPPAAIPVRLPTTVKRTTYGRVSGTLAFDQVGIDIFEGLTIRASIIFQSGVLTTTGTDQTPAQPRSSADIEFALIKGDTEITLLYDPPDAGTTSSPTNTLGDTFLTINFDNLTLGDLLNFFVSLVDDDIEGFNLDSPWDMLQSINLSGLQVRINLTKREVSVDVNRSINLGFMSISKFRFRYSNRMPNGQLTPDGKASVMIELMGNFLGTTYDDKKPLGWDTMNQPAPATPGQGSAIFDLDYLGIGQHIAFNPEKVAELDTIDKVMNALIRSIQDDGTANILQFNKESGWLIGARFTLIGTVSMSIIFNDPVMYGLLISLAGPKAGSFAGLRFEILYRRITDTIGVYHTELTLPAAMRQLQFGAVSVTLPVVALDIYTNGDFRIDVGFPRNGDWSRAIYVEVLIFTGAAGFYFAKLSGATSTRVPKITDGVFNPVIEFGLALRIGLGRTFTKGPLNAEISITIQGIFEGVFAWYNPNNPNKPSAQYYYLQATVMIVGRLYGSVDFEVIKVEVEVLIYAGVRVTFEVYKPLEIVLVAGVKVRASIKIVFVRIHFSFSVEIRERFSFGSNQPTPWTLAPANAAMTMPAALAYSKTIPAGYELGSTVPQPAPQAINITATLDWENDFQVWPTLSDITLYFQPAFTEGFNESGDVEVKGVALLFVENAISPDARSYTDYASAPTADKDFNRLAQAGLAWAVRALSDRSSAANTEAEGNFSAWINTAEVTLGQLYTLRAMLEVHQNNESMPFNYETLIAFLTANFTFIISDYVDATKPQLSVTYFPIFPELSLKLNGTLYADFGTYAQVDAGDLKQILEFYNDLKSGGLVEMQANSTASSGQFSLATFVFTDYFAMLIRSSVQGAIDYLEDEGVAVIGLASLLRELSDSSGKFNHVSGMVSRFMLYGLRLPFKLTESAGVSNLEYDPDTTTPLYTLTGQQFPFIVAEGSKVEEYTITLEETDKTEAEDEVRWLRFLDYDYRVTPPTLNDNSSQIDYRLTVAQQTQVATLSTPEDVTFAIESRAPIKLSRTSPRHFPLQQHIAWQIDDGQEQTYRSIYALPSSLRDALSVQRSAVVTIKTGTHNSDTGQMDVTDLTDFEWVTRIEFQVRQAPSLDGTGIQPNVYIVTNVGEAAQDTMQDIWEAIRTQRIKRPPKRREEDTTEATPPATLPQVATLTLNLLYPKTGAQADTSGLLSGVNAHARLLKTDLSVDSGTLGVGAADLKFAADLNAPNDFLRLLWESGHSESGGFHLYYSRDGDQGLPDYLFASSQTATLSLLISTNNLNVPALHNAMMTSTVVDLETSVLFAESASMIEHSLTVQPGHVGFHIVANQPDDNAILPNLFQLLTYSLAATDGFRANTAAMPVGPLEDDDDTQWVYEKVIPYYKFVESSPSANAAHEPLAEANPYLGISAGAELRIEFDLQDVYGNRTTSDNTGDNAPLSPMPLPVGYTDNIVGLNQWPLLTENYLFAQETGTRQILVTLHLELESVIATPGTSPAKAQEKVESALKSYRTIFYQLSQPDLKFQLSTSINVAPPADLPTTDFQNFASAAFRTLLALYALRPVQVSASTLDSLSADYYVTPAEIAEANENVPGLFSSITVRGQAVTMQADETLAALIAKTNEDTSQPTYTLEQFAAENGSIIFHVPATIPFLVDVENDTDNLQALYARLQVTPPTSFAASGLATNQSLSDLAQANGISLSDLALANQNIRGLLKSQASVNLRGKTVTIRANETLRTLAARLSPSLTDVGAALTSDVLVSGALITLPTYTYTTQAGDTFAALSGNPHFAATLAALADANADVSGLFVTNPQVTRGEETIILDKTKTVTELVADLNADLAEGERLYTAVWIVEANQTAQLQAGVTITIHSRPRLSSNQTLSDLAAAYPEITFADLLEANQDVRGLLHSNALVTIGGAALSIRPDETLHELTARFAVTVAEVAGALNAAALTTNISLILPPARVNFDPVALIGSLPADFIFPVTAEISMSRDARNVHPEFGLAEFPAVYSVTASLSPQTPSGQEDVASLQHFANTFENVFANIRLAVGKTDSESTSSQPLWGVNFNHIEVTINPAKALYFAPSPLANTLVTGDAVLPTYTSGTATLSTGQNKTFQSVDLDTWGRVLLTAIDEFLQPATAAPASDCNDITRGYVTTILEAKSKLADAIAADVTHILETDTAGDYSTRRNEAAEALRQQMLANLMSAYNIETVVQFPVTIALTGTSFGEGREPRLSGKPKVIASGATVDHTLSAARLPLKIDGTYLTFLYNTQAPASERSANLTLVFDYHEIEHDITPYPGIAQYRASSWLTFITEFDPETIGEVEIPIPLRAYPVPPSLILQRAEADPNSVESLAQIREWQYTYIYEHLNAAQDVIESAIAYNAAPMNNAPQTTFVSAPLFGALAQFTHLYPLLAADLALWAAQPQDEATATVPTAALAVFAQLVNSAADAWRDWVFEPTEIVENDTAFEIQEVNSGENPAFINVTMFTSNEIPLISLPGYTRRDGEPVEISTNVYQYTFDQKTPAEAATEISYGVASVPDRQIIVPNRDIIGDQSAWGAVWLMRNNDLVTDVPTNLAFVYETPRIRFSNPVAPLLVNDVEWDIAEITRQMLPNQSSYTLHDHIDALFHILLRDEAAPRAFDIRLDCRYAFVLNGVDGELLSTLPLLLGPRLSVAAGQNPLVETESFRDNLAESIRLWKQTNLPVENGALYLFTLSVLSSFVAASDESLNTNVNLPLLYINNLRLKLTDVVDVETAAVGD